ncbi:hypothetical protein Y032_0090g2342 [Ancylostoma ceylanicum]|uniref:Uncharacterized protein n=1 Tax=Ancylostoma ceylanicum TaxID=53326 RepID=A0A016TNA8_9BILA|nr:hypothetical protein Y032_0090g2342 [Ancylostoma ceylanicum]
MEESVGGVKGLSDSFLEAHLLRKILHIERVSHPLPNRIEIALHVWQVTTYVMREPCNPEEVRGAKATLQGFCIMYYFARHT